jgi:phosphate transport system protein
MLLSVRRIAPEHSSRDFETELRELRAHILAMGARCERIVGLAFDGFLKGTSDIERDVVALDAQIDRDELEIHALIMRILALRQPVADDLRFLATALRLITDLERIGDEAVNIAERAVKEDSEVKRLVGNELGAMAGAALDMLHLALDAFVRGDDEQADRVLECDDDVDRRCATVIATMTTYISEHADEVHSGLRVVRVAKLLERIADHATNVAEEDIFMVRGDDVRHGRWRLTARASVTPCAALPMAPRSHAG